jgi:hypothetical protein
MSTETPPTVKNRNWLWIFIGLGLLAAVLLTWLALFIQEQLLPGKQLQRDQLAAARNLWKEKGSKNYQMLYIVKRGGQAGEDNYFVEVRGGEVRIVTLNGKALPEHQWHYHSMDGLFEHIDRFLIRDAEPNAPRTYCRGYFSNQDGSLALFVRRVVGSQTREAVEIEVKEFKPMPAK